MVNKKTEDNKSLKKFMWRNIIAFIFIIILIFLRQYIIQSKINNDMNFSKVVNVSGRQRMLSQQITKDAYALTYYVEEEKIDFYINEITIAKDLWEQENINLRKGIIDGTHVFNNSDTIIKLFSEIEGNHQAILEAVKNIIQLHSDGSYHHEDIYDYIDDISKNESIYLIGMDKIVLEYDNEAKEKMTSLGNVEIILFVILVGSVMFQLAFMFIPEQKKLRKAFQDISYLSYHDRLTGIYNRYLFDQKISEEIERANRNYIPLSMAILDLDHFKNVNDNWGHPIGDEVLKRTAEITKYVLRKSDILARLGGEEFIILMPNTSIDGAVTVAEKIRKALADELHPTAGKVTASLGVAERKLEEAYFNWYQRVDDALYIAKNEGRNRVVSANINENLSIVSVKFDWRDKWNSGEVTIDQQHKELLVCGNGIIQDFLSGKSKEKVAENMEVLLNKLIMHFEYEECVLKELKYPDLFNHSIIHQRLKEKTMEIENFYKNDDLNPNTFFSFFVDEVIIGHIQAEDTKYFTYTKNQNN